MKKVNKLRELQLINVFIFRELNSICKDNNIKLYLLGGTLIGAVRHHGFIPWDDDMDLCISRPDYNKLIELTNKKIGKYCTLIDPKSDPEYKGYVPVVVYNNSSLISKQYRGNEILHIGLSLFVYDGAPSNKRCQKKYYRKMYLLRAKHALCRANFKNVNTKAAKVVGPILSPFFKERNVFKYKNKILNLQEKYQYEVSDLVSTNADKDSILEICSKSEFEKSIVSNFEGIPCFIFSHYDSHLKKYYGDYMKLPPENEQNPKHSFDAYIADEFDYDFLKKDVDLC